MTGTCIVKRGKRYAVQVYMGRDPENAKRRRYKWHGGFTTRREAETFRATMAHHPAFSAGVGAYGNSRLRVGDYLDQWLKTHTSTKPISETTEVNYRLVIEKHLKPSLGHIPLVRLSPQTIQDLYGSLITKGLGRTSVRHIANQLHLALEHAVRRGLIARNPTDQTDPPSRDTKPTITLTPAQLRAFLKDASQTAPPYLSGLYWLLAGTGMRLGEALGLTESDLVLDQSALSIRQTLK